MVTVVNQIRNLPISYLSVTESRKVVMETTETFGGQYSPSLDSKCTHLVVQSLGGHKLKHTLRHRYQTSLFVVTLDWFIDSAQRNVRLSESLYSIHTHTSIPELLEGKDFCSPLGLKHVVTSTSSLEERYAQLSEEVFGRTKQCCLSGQRMYIDSNISAELRSKVVQAATLVGALFMNEWFVGCGASYVVCEGSSISRYLGHSDNIVHPMWILRTAKDGYMPKVARISIDLARDIGMLLENFTDEIAEQENCKRMLPQDNLVLNSNETEMEEKKQMVNIAKSGVRSRRIHCMQSYPVPLQVVNPRSFLDSVCWSISDPSSTATIYVDSLSTVVEDVEALGARVQSSACFNLKVDGGALDSSFSHLSRPLKESEKNELVYRHHFLTVLFPVDRFDEMGPTSRTYFSDKGFTCLQVLDLIYAFYQGNLSEHEIEAAIHTDSRHADKLRLMYATQRTAKDGPLSCKRIDLLGSRRNFEKLRRVSGGDIRNVYELVIT